MSFPITCTACNKTFTISDEIFEKKVAGRVVTIKCKACGQGIRVDGTKGGSVAAPAAAPVAPVAPAPAVVAAPAAAPVPVLAATPAAVPPAAPAELLWAVDYPDGQDREFTTAEVIAELERGAIERTTLVWRDGMGEWLELHQITELAIELAKIEAKKRAAAAAAAAAKAGPVHKPRAPMPTVTGLAGLPGAALKPRAQQPSSPELFKPRAQQPSSPELPKPRAALGSSPGLPRPPVLATRPDDFDDDEITHMAPPRMLADILAAEQLPATPPAPPPAVAAPAPPTVTQPLPIPAAAPPPPPPLPPPAPMPDVTPPLPASVAKVVSRPPQVPAFPGSSAPITSAPITPFATAPAVASDHATVEWPEAKSKTPLIIGAAVAAVVLIGVGVLVFGGNETPPPPSTPISAAPSPAATPVTPTSTPTPATPATPGAEAATSRPGSDTASGSDPIATADPGATPGAGFAELFAAGARKAESKGSTVAPAARFDAAATKAPLAEAATQAQACKQSGGPTGKVTVVVTFDPNGKVSGATITEAPFAGTATGACISQALKRASIPPFSGLPGTVSKTFSIL